MELPVIGGVDDDGEIAGRGTVGRPWASFAPPTPPASATTRGTTPLSRPSSSRTSPFGRWSRRRTAPAGARRSCGSRGRVGPARRRRARAGRGASAPSRRPAFRSRRRGRGRRPAASAGSSRTTIGKLTVRSIVAGSRPTAAQCSSQDRLACRDLVEFAVRFQPSARRATVRSVFLGPQPPTRIGRWSWSGAGAGRHRGTRSAPHP